MTKLECKEKLQEIRKIAVESNLHSAVVFFQDAINLDVQCRYIFAPEYAECNIWFNYVIGELPKKCQKQFPSYAGYINNKLEHANGILFTD